jgi:hypothetical protein
MALLSLYKIRTFERKSMPIVAWYMLSKESYMNRVIRDVFPTAELSVMQSLKPFDPFLHTTLLSEKHQSFLSIRTLSQAHVWWGILLEFFQRVIV